MKVITAIITVLVLSSGWLYAQDMLHVNKTSGRNDYTFSQLHKMTFENGSLILTFKDGTTNTFSLAEISNLTFTEATSIENRDVNRMEIKLYPNPVGSILNIALENYSEAQITIIDLNGKLIKSSVISGTSIIDVSQLASGAYLLQVKVSDKMTTKLFIKE